MKAVRNTSYNSYLFHSVLSLEEGLKLIENEECTKVVVNDIEVKTKSLRLKIFQNKGTVCVGCGLTAVEFRVQQGKKSPGYHIGLWNDNIQFTKDHIIPKSKGGVDKLENMQTMCEICNCLKGNNL